MTDEGTERDPDPRGGAPSTALMTDHYGLTMLDAALGSGVAEHRAVFELWGRSLPGGRRYGVVAGTARAVAAIRAFRFTDEQLDFLGGNRIVSPETVTWLADFRFTGDVDGYAEGELYFPRSPILTVEASLGEALLLETVLLSVYNHDSAVASAAARMVTAARGRPLLEMGSRRTHEEAAVAVARAAYLTGFSATSNLLAGYRHGVPTAGTVAHAFVMAHPDELSAFLAQLTAQGVDTTVLVDTYDIPEGICRAVRAASSFGASGPGAIRIDTGDLVVETRRARRLLDELGAAATRIVVSGDLDEYRIEALEGASGGRAPIDAYGVGTSVTTGSGHPTASFIYKLVAVADAPGRAAPMRRVHKDQQGKATHGGRKAAYRAVDATGHAVAELLVADRQQGGRVSGPPQAPPGGELRPLQVALIRGGEPVPQPSISQAREAHRRALGELDEQALWLSDGSPALQAQLASEAIDGD